MMYQTYSFHTNFHSSMKYGFQCKQGRGHREVVGVSHPKKIGMPANLQKIFSLSANLQLGLEFKTSIWHTPTTAKVHVFPTLQKQTDYEYAC